MRIHFLAILLLISALPIFSEEQWTLEYKDPLVAVSGRKVPYCRYREFKSVTTVQAPLRQVFHVFTNYYDYDKWFGYCVDSYTVKEHSPERQTVFLLIDTPWPIIDKYLLPDIVLDPSFDDGDAAISFKLAEGRYRIREGKYEPVVKLLGECTLEAEGMWDTKVTFVCAMDPGGNIPVVFIEKFQLDQMVKTAVNLHKHLEFLSYFRPGITESYRLVADE